MEEHKFEFDNLFAGSAENVRTTLTLQKGQSVKLGQTLGRLGTGELVILDKARTDLGKTIYAIAAEDCDATEQDTRMVVHETGEFNIRALIFAPKNTVEDHERDARALNIFFKSTVAK